LIEDGELGPVATNKTSTRTNGEKRSVTWEVQATTEYFAVVYMDIIHSEVWHQLNPYDVSQVQLCGDHTIIES